MARRIAISQSNYIPWKGYFNIIKDVDEFVLLDDVQYTRRDWRNRNLIKTPSGLKWLTIPVDVKGRYEIKIKDVQIVDENWRREHWSHISQTYKTAPYFSTYREQFENMYLGKTERNLSAINLDFITFVNSLLGITTPIRSSMEFDSPIGKSERLIHICKCLKADEYISGPSAKAYLDCPLFEQNGIEVKWADYSDYPCYHQLHPPFEHGVSIVDLLFNAGSDSHVYLKQNIIL